MRLRLNYRTFFQVLEGGRGKLLPLPPRSLWSFDFADEGPTRRTIDGHDVLAVDYEFEGTLLSGPNDPRLAEPALATVGGVWEEPFVFPIDPKHLFARTGHACVRETGAEVVVDSENVLRFYDHECEAEAPGIVNCHPNRPGGTWPVSCDQALTDEVGRVPTTLRFERLPWDEDLADAIRIGDPGATPDLKVLPEGLEDYRVVWRYFDIDHCALEEACVGDAGWRRLLMFDASLENLGAAPMHVGAVSDSALAEHRVFEFSSCHMHDHFSFYGDFTFEYGAGMSIGEKQAFCLVSTTRYGNHEAFPLTHPYIDCNTQGIAAGWGDDYYAGIDCQWIDVTEAPVWSGPVEGTLRFTANPERFLCEGTPVTDDSGEQAFESTEFRNDLGEPIDRPLCEMADGWDLNNEGTADVTLDGRGMIARPCASLEASPKRNCGYEAPERLTCTPGETVTLTCTGDAAEYAVLRVCEVSTLYDSPIPCLAEQAVADGVVDEGSLSLTFECPAERSVRIGETGGEIAVYTGALLPGETAPAISCTL